MKNTFKPKRYSDANHELISFAFNNYCYNIINTLKVGSKNLILYSLVLILSNIYPMSFLIYKILELNFPFNQLCVFTEGDRSSEYGGHDCG